MTDLEKWQEWLDQWDVEYRVQKYTNYRGYPTIELEIDGCYACAAIVFKQNTKEFMYMDVNE